MDTIINNATHYKGLPLMYWHPKCRDGFFQAPLEQNYRLLHYFITEFQKLLVVRFDLHYSPEGCSQGFTFPKSNKCFQRLIDNYSQFFLRKGIPYGYFWCRERDLEPVPGIDTDQEYPNPYQHWHVYFIVPYGLIKKFSFSKQGYDMELKKDWNRAIQFKGSIKKAPVFFPNNGEFPLTQETLPEVFTRLSYLCKICSKETDLPFKTKRWMPSQIPRDITFPPVYQYHTASLNMSNITYNEPGKIEQFIP